MILHFQKGKLILSLDDDEGTTKDESIQRFFQFVEEATKGLNQWTEFLNSFSGEMNTSNEEHIEAEDDNTK